MTNETTASQPKSIGDDAQDWAHGPDEIAYSSCNLTMGQSRLLAAIKCGDKVVIESRAPAAQASATIQAGQWVRCTPDLINAGVDCAHTPRRPGDGTYSHDHFIAHSAATIQEPVMVAEPVQVVVSLGDTWADSCIVCQQRGEFGIATQKGPDGCREAVESGEIYCAEHIGDAIRPTLAAPMVADPAGAAPEMIQWRNIQKVVAAVADFCFGSKDDPVYGASHCAVTTCLTAKDGVKVTLEPLAATVNAVPSEALDAGPFTLEQRMPPKDTEVLIYWSCSDGTFGCAVDEWSDLYEDPIGMGGPTICVGEGWMRHEADVKLWAPIPAVNFAARLADKTGGGE